MSDSEMSESEMSGSEIEIMTMSEVFAECRLLTKTEVSEYVLDNTMAINLDEMWMNCYGIFNCEADILLSRTIAEALATDVLEMLDFDVLYESKLEIENETGEEPTFWTAYETKMRQIGAYERSSLASSIFIQQKV